MGIKYDEDDYYNPETVEEVFDFFIGPLVKKDKKTVRDFDDAEEITQSVFVKAYENLKDYNPQYKFFSWLYRIAVNESINFKKRKSNVSELNENETSLENDPNKICENNRGVIVTTVAGHNCVSCRGVKHQGASMITTKASGVFMENGNQARSEFFDSLKINNGGHQI